VFSHKGLEKVVLFLRRKSRGRFGQPTVFPSLAVAVLSKAEETV
jgi:hypothetical protein